MKKMSWDEARQQILAEKTSKELSALIKQIKEIFTSEADSPHISADEYNSLLTKCYDEQNRRSAEKLGNAILYAGVVGVWVAALALILK